MGATAAGALRLAHRVLEMHVDVGYATGVWLNRVWRQADRGAPGLEHARGAAVALAAATAATADENRMRVPEDLAHGLSDLLVVYLIARGLR